MAYSKINRAGFTIVELIIVIVVISILAAISTVTYTGIQDRARSVALASNLKNATKLVEISYAENSEYPTDLSAINLPSGSTYGYKYIDNDSYCLDATDSSSNTKFTTNVTSESYLGPCPAGYWALDSDGRDSSGNDSTVTIIGASPTEDRFGKQGKAYSFDGDDLMRINPQPSVLMPTAEVSVAAWIYPTAYSGAYQGIVNSGSGGYWLYLSSAGVPGFYVTSISVNAANPLPLNEWSFIVGTHKAGQQKVYVNGIEVASGAFSGPIGSYLGTFYIGNIKNTIDRYFIGTIDDIGIYTTALTPAQVRSMYNLGR